jgi:NTE family protein
MTRRAVVLGAGGHAAIAWELGVIAGLADGGVDVRNADLFIGTSAGAIVGAQITSVVPLEALFQQQADPGRQTAETAPSIDFVRWRTELTRAQKEAADRADFLRRIGALAVGATTVSEVERRRVIASRLPADDWPEKRLRIAAVDAQSGERCVFDRTSGVSLVDAVAASAAVAGIWPAATIAGRRYIDGGFYSIDNADLAVGFERVLILTLRARVPSRGVVSLDQALDRLRANGACVDVVHPDDEAEAAFASVHGNLLDPAVRAPAAHSGREQGRRIASSLLF